MNDNDLKELFAGSVGGALATIVEYPLDTIKVRLQNDSSRYRGSFSCITDIVRYEGIINGFFKGLPAPLVAAAMENAALFYTYRAAMNSIQDFFYRKRFEPDTEPYTLVFGAAAVGGVVVSHVLTPAELIKCKLQVQNTLPVEKRTHKNSLHCAMSIYRELGMRGLYKGHISMLVREAVGCGLYFLTFEFVIRNMLKENQNFAEASPFVHFFGGGCAGVAFWTSIYPVDVLKTKVQTGNGDYNGLSLRHGMRQLYRREGMRGLMRGYFVTAARAFPGNAVLIAVYEQVNLLWTSSNKSHRASFCLASCVGNT